MMFWTAGAVRRVLLILLLLSATVCAQTPSLALAHGHPHSSQHCCGLCHAGPLPFLQAAVTDTGMPELPVAWLSVVEESSSPDQRLISDGCSRAPPLA